MNISEKIKTLLPRLSKRQAKRLAVILSATRRLYFINALLKQSTLVRILAVQLFRPVVPIIEQVQDSVQRRVFVGVELHRVVECLADVAVVQNLYMVATEAQSVLPVDLRLDQGMGISFAVSILCGL